MTDTTTPTNCLACAAPLPADATGNLCAPCYQECAREADEALREIPTYRPSTLDRQTEELYPWPDTLDLALVSSGRSPPLQRDRDGHSRRSIPDDPSRCQSAVNSG
jgi:hypothetical protein